MILELCSSGEGCLSMGEKLVVAVTGVWHNTKLKLGVMSNMCI